MFDRPRPWWVLASLPLGLTTWIGFLYAGVRARMRSLQILAGVFFVSMVAAFALSGDHPEGSFREEFAEWFIACVFLLGVGLSIALAPAWQRRMRSGVLEAEKRLAAREEARRLAAERPELARELGVGRPDLGREADHAGLVDVNNASPHVLVELPGIDYETANEIARVREELGGFSSLADMGAVMDLPAATVERLRDRTVFLPR
ncbi:MAG TPA: helix-hairpin-helix domain-containing protein [Solirubrobacteraceae bacterium]|nr:helix-hairpin-helix domain-containing protein [Solirubrobacteraceae bacterium]